MNSGIAQEYYTLSAYYIEEIVKLINNETLYHNGRFVQMLTQETYPTGPGIMKKETEYVAIMARGRSREEVKELLE